ncbi:MAG: DNA-3-methyladenine glycosylase [Parachlamydiaceae bacterium]|nr:DNA-3-methyladenine glycosylase [Parachlamydiaceae bacterium]
MIKYPKLPLTFYQQDNVLQISKLLIGKYLFTNNDGIITGGMIVETEAYRGIDDRASHAYGMKMTKRNEVMYGAGGHAYIYLCYGIHLLFNVVTNQKGIPHGILIKAIEPQIGIEKMMERRKKTKLNRSLTGGPGALTEALGMSIRDNGTSLIGSMIWLEDRNIKIDPEQIIATPRIGVDYAGEDAMLPWRFRIKNNPWTSPAKEKK